MIGILAIFLIVPALNAPLSTVDEINKAIIHYRKDLGPGTVSYTCRRKGEQRFSGKIDSVEHCRIDFTAFDTRIDVRVEPGGIRSFREYSLIVTPTRSVHFEIADGEYMRNDRVQIYSAQSTHTNHKLYLISPEAIGLLGSPSPNVLGIQGLQGESAESILEHEDVISKEVIAEELDGKTIYRTTVDTHLKYGDGIFRQQNWVAPDRGYSVVKSECRYIGTDDDRAAKLVATYEKTPIGNRWFVKTAHTDFEEKGIVNYQEDFIVTEAQFGVDPSPERFEITDLGIPVDTPVLKDGKRYFWDGKRLLSSNFPTSPESKQTSRAVRWYCSVPIWISLLSISLAVLLLLRIKIRKQAGVNHSSL